MLALEKAVVPRCVAVRMTELAWIAEHAERGRDDVAVYSPSKQPRE